MLSWTFFFSNFQQVRWRYQISICFLTMLITIITQASSGNGNRVPNTMVLPLVGLLRHCLWLREICYAKEFSSICHKRDRGFNQSLWETLYQKGCKSMKMWCFCAWVIIDPMKHVEKQKRERGCDVVKNRLLKRMNAKCLSKHKTLKWDFRSNASICMFAFQLQG